MKSEYEIYMDFYSAMDQVAKLRTISSDVESIGTDDIGGSITSIQASWTGENSESYIAKSEMVKEKVITTGGDIGKVADTIQAIAERIRDAELEALRIAES